MNVQNASTRGPWNLFTCPFPTTTRGLAGGARIASAGYLYVFEGLAASALVLHPRWEHSIPIAPFEASTEGLTFGASWMVGDFRLAE